jgi:hypothetical protein
LNHFLEFRCITAAEQAEKHQQQSDDRRGDHDFRGNTPRFGRRHDAVTLTHVKDLPKAGLVGPQRAYL